MAKLSIRVKTNEEVKSIKVEGVSELEIVRLIESTIGQAKSANPPIKISISRAAREFIEEVHKENDESKPLSKRQSRSITVLHSTPETSVAVAEPPKKELEHVKYSPGGDLLFRTHVSCVCGSNHPMRHVGLTSAYLKCFECKERLEVVPASLETQTFEGRTVPVMDEHGYYYYAYSPYEFKNR